MATPLLCLTCHQPIPEGEDYPGFFGQHHTSPDLTDQEHVKDELGVVFDYLAAVCEVIPEAVKVDDKGVRDLAHLARDLAEEAQRRTEWLYQAGKSPSPEREKT